MSILKVVHINTSFRGGAGRAVNRLHEALLKNGVNSSFLSLDASPDLHSKMIFSEFRQPQSISFGYHSFLQSLKSKFLFRMKKYFGIQIEGNNEREIGVFNHIKKDLDCEFSSLPFSVYNVLENSLVKEADIIHLHWIAGMVDYESFFRINNKPIVWTLHDMNPFQGIFHYKEDELRNVEVSGKLDKKIRELKERVITKRKSALFIVAPSNWLLNEAKKSKAFAGVQGFCISNAIDTSVFTNQKSDVVKKINRIPENNIVFLFAAHSVNVHRKGFDILIETLKKIKFASFTLLVLGTNDDNVPNGLDIIYLGSENDDNKLINYYSVADAFIIPSREDNLPNVMLESFACGTPVIAFSVGGIKEHIIDFKTGLLAKEINAESLEQAIEDFCNNKQRFDRSFIQNYAIDNFGEQLIANKYNELYHEVIKIARLNGQTFYNNN